MCYSPKTFEIELNRYVNNFKTPKLVKLFVVDTESNIGFQTYLEYSVLHKILLIVHLKVCSTDAFCQLH
jgi:hypothetical protein